MILVRIFLFGLFLLCWHGSAWCSVNDGSCPVSRDVETMYIGPSADRLLEIHVRHNLKGSVEVRDASPDKTQVEIQVEKLAASKEDLEGIQIDQLMYDVGHGNILILQTDYKEKATALLTIIGGVVAVVVLLAFIVLVIWLYHKKHMEPPTRPLRRSNSRTSSGQPSPTIQRSRREAPVSGHQEISRGVPGALPHQRSASSSMSEIHSLPSGGVNLPPTPPPPPMPRLPYGNGSCTTPGDAGSSRGAQGGGGSPRGYYKGTLVTFSILAILSLVCASCLTDREVNIVIIIPHIIKLGKIGIFYNTKYYNDVKSDLWTQKNITQLQIFDLKNVAPTDKAPCQSSHVCPNANAQKLAGCDASSGECVCQRGYILDKGICIDLDECYSQPIACPQGAACRNSIGSFVCDCGTGYYHKGGLCLECSVGCPIGLYEAIPCSISHDRHCAACDECERAMYEAKPCQGSNDRHCIHAAHPLLISEEETTTTFLEELKVESSPNVFMESLHNTKNLETTYYVTDNKQSTDFFWFRDSGIRINIGISNINMIPEYEDVDHQSDDNFMTGNPNSMEQKRVFNNIMRYHCRHPIPDHYTLTLETAKDRTTKASERTCHSASLGVDSDCPEGLSDGDKYIVRTLNEPCHKMGSYPVRMDPAANSVVCTKSTELLRKLFNVDPAITRPIRFPPKRCKPAISRCAQCMDQRRCHLYDPFDQMCNCDIDCLTLPDCKLAKSIECSSTDIECAQGDAYRYTIQPVFEQINHEYSCHIRHRPPKVLYQLWFYVSVTGTEFETPRIYKKIYPGDVQNLSHGDYSMEFLTIEHSTGIKLHDEFILVGQEKPGFWNHTVIPRKMPWEYSRRRVPVHSISDGVYVSNVQFDEPFGYSTWTWVQKNSCDKNVTKFKSVQKHYQGEAQSVNVITQAVGSPYQYFLRSGDNPPHLRFLIPANISVIRWWFTDKEASLVVDDSLKVTLRQTVDDRIWSILIQGSISSCPGYLGITINDRLEQEELFRYDTLISCPRFFNVTFKVPNWGVKQDKTFDVVLDDAKTQYTVYLTHLHFEDYAGYNTPSARLTKGVNPGEAQKESWFTFSLAVVSGVILLMFAMYAYLELTRKSTMMKIKDENFGRFHQGLKESPGCCQASRKMTSGQFLFVTLYVVFKIIYSLFFTFTLCTTLVIICLHQDIEIIKDVGFAQARQYNKTKDFQGMINNYMERELKRQNKMVTNMQGACNQYMEDLMGSMLKQIENTTSEESIHLFVNEKESISNAMKLRFDQFLQDYDKEIALYTEKYQENFDKNIKTALVKYKNYLAKVYDNGWFQFPLSLYKVSKSLETLQPPKKKVRQELSGEEFEFAKSLARSLPSNSNDVEEVQLWPVQFWERFEADKPQISELKVELPNFICVQKSAADAARALYNASTQRYMDSNKFFSRSRNSVDGKTEHATKYGIAHVNVFSVEEFFKGLNLDILRLVLLCLDVLILLYRLSHIYLNCHKMCLGFEESVLTTPEEFKKHQEMSLLHEENKSELLVPLKEDCDLTEMTANIIDSGQRIGPQLSQPSDPGYEGDTVSHGHSEVLTAHKYTKHKPNGNAMPIPDLRDTHYASVNAHQSGSVIYLPKRDCAYIIKSFIMYLVDSELVPKLAIGSALLVLIYIIVRLINNIFSADSFLNITQFVPLASSLELEIDSVYQYLELVAKEYTLSVSTWYRSHMEGELLQLKAMLQFFNNEKDRSYANYVAEVCAIKGHTNETCNIHMKGHSLRVPVVPCNFVPVQAQQFHDLPSIQQDLSKDFEPIIGAARHFLITFINAAIIAMSLMSIIYLLGTILFHFFKTREVFHVHYVYVMSNVSAVQSLQPLTPHIESILELDDNVTLESKSSVATPGGTPQRRVQKYGLSVQFKSNSPSKTKTETLLTDMGYSETKV